MPYHITNGANICYQEIGNGPNILVFIHGGNGGMLSSITTGYGANLPKRNHSSPISIPLTTNGGMYGSMVNRLKNKDRTIVTYDRRCAGASEYTINKFYTLETLGTDCLQLMKHLGHDTFTVIGSSMGGPIALWLAINHSNSINKLIVLNSHPCIVGSYPPYNMNTYRYNSFQKIMKMSSTQQKQYFIQKNHAKKMKSQLLIDIDAGGASLETLRTTVQLLSNDTLFQYWTGELHNLFCYLEKDFSNVLNLIKMPTLIVHGDADLTVPYDGAIAMHQGIVGSTLYTVKGGGHGMPGDTECQSIVVKWLDDNRNISSSRL